MCAASLTSLSHQAFSMSVAENQAADAIVGTVQAYDADKDNARFTFTLVKGPDSGHFQVHQDTGMVTTRGVLDREVKGEYRFQVKVSGGRGEREEVVGSRYRGSWSR